jgi:hypothetical protein
MSDWISVKDRLPEEYELVWVFYMRKNRPTQSEGMIYDSSKHLASESHPESFWKSVGYGLVWEDGFGRQIQSLTAKKSKNNVTHWMPLPEPPKQ